MGRPIVGVVSFPGSNGDHDALWAFHRMLDLETRLVDYRETSPTDVDAFVLPGGFTFGDYLRCGAIARFAPVMEAVARFADAGGPVLGICNGFQILTEAHLLPGALLRNRTLRFHCHWTHVRLDSSAAPLMKFMPPASVLRLPVAHGDGAYYLDTEQLDSLERHGQVIARYCTSDGDVTSAANANGSVGNIAGICNRRGNVIGLMPHPERAVEAALGGQDGLLFLRAFLQLVGVEPPQSAPATAGAGQLGTSNMRREI